MDTVISSYRRQTTNNTVPIIQYKFSIIIQAASLQLIREQSRERGTRGRQGTGYNKIIQGTAHEVQGYLVSLVSLVSEKHSYSRRGGEIDEKVMSLAGDRINGTL